MNFNALDEYESDLALVLAPMPDEKRAQVLAEVRAHLEAMIEARRADGQSVEVALADALGSFGAADGIGSELLNEWARGPRMEARGTPLTKREKWRQIAPIVGWVFVVYPLIMWLLPLMQGWKWEGLTMSALVVAGFASAMWRAHKSGRWLHRPAYRFIAVVNALHILVLIIYFNRSVMPQGAQRVFEIWMPIYFVLSFIGLAWWMRERKTNPPWRALATYQANPVATEERYRLSQTSGLIIGGAMGIVYTLWMSWNFFGLIYGIGTSVILLGFYALLYRWIR